MTDEQLELARQLCRHRRFGGVKDLFTRMAADGAWAVPDLTDDATGGVLLGMLDPSGMQGITACRERDGTWWVNAYTGTTLAEAAARALLGVERDAER